MYQTIGNAQTLAEESLASLVSARRLSLTRQAEETLRAAQAVAAEADDLAARLSREAERLDDEATLAESRAAALAEDSLALVAAAEVETRRREEETRAERLALRSELTRAEEEVARAAATVAEAEETFRRSSLRSFNSALEAEAVRRSVEIVARRLDYARVTLRQSAEARREAALDLVAATETARDDLLPLSLHRRAVSEIARAEETLRREALNARRAEEEVALLRPRLRAVVGFIEDAREEADDLAARSALDEEALARARLSLRLAEGRLRAARRAVESSEARLARQAVERREAALAESTTAARSARSARAEADRAARQAKKAESAADARLAEVAAAEEAVEVARSGRGERLFLLTIRALTDEEEALRSARRLLARRQAEERDAKSAEEDDETLAAAAQAVAAAEAEVARAAEAVARQAVASSEVILTAPALDGRGAHALAVALAARLAAASRPDEAEVARAAETLASEVARLDRDDLTEGETDASRAETVARVEARASLYFLRDDLTLDGDLLAAAAVDISRAVARRVARNEGTATQVRIAAAARARRQDFDLDDMTAAAEVALSEATTASPEALAARAVILRAVAERRESSDLRERRAVSVREERRAVVALTRREGRVDSSAVAQAVIVSAPSEVAALVADDSTSDRRRARLYDRLARSAALLRSSRQESDDGLARQAVASAVSAAYIAVDLYLTEARAVRVSASPAPLSLDDLTEGEATEAAARRAAEGDEAALVEAELFRAVDEAALSLSPAARRALLAVARRGSRSSGARAVGLSRSTVAGHLLTAARALRDSLDARLAQVSASVAPDEAEPLLVPVLRSLVAAAASAVDGQRVERLAAVARASAQREEERAAREAVKVARASALAASAEAGGKARAAAEVARRQGRLVAALDLAGDRRAVAEAVEASARSLAAPLAEVAALIRDGLTERETAERLDRSRSAVHERATRARDALAAEAARVASSPDLADALRAASLADLLSLAR